MKLSTAKKLLYLAVEDVIGQHPMNEPTRAALHKKLGNIIETIYQDNEHQKEVNITIPKIFDLYPTRFMDPMAALVLGGKLASDANPLGMLMKTMDAHAKQAFAASQKSQPSTAGPTIGKTVNGATGPDMTKVVNKHPHVDFMDALKFLKMGNSVRRENWPPFHHMKLRSDGVFRLVTSKNDIQGFGSATMAGMEPGDLLATDWHIYP